MFLSLFKSHMKETFCRILCLLQMHTTQPHCINGKLNFLTLSEFRMQTKYMFLVQVFEPKINRRLCNPAM